MSEVTLKLVDIDEALESLAKPDTKEGYTPAKGTEKLVHLMLTKGNRFSAKTGKEINPPYRQVFTFSEWQLFKNNFKGLGYTITEVLHDPYGEAEKYVEKEEKEKADN